MHVSAPCVLCWKQAAKEGSTLSVTDQNCGILSSNCPLHNTTVLCRTAKTSIQDYSPVIAAEKSPATEQLSRHPAHKTVTESSAYRTFQTPVFQEAAAANFHLNYHVFWQRLTKTGRQRMMSIFCQTCPTFWLLDHCADTVTNGGSVQVCVHFVKLPHIQ